MKMKNCILMHNYMPKSIILRRSYSCLKLISRIEDILSIDIVAITRVNLINIPTKKLPLNFNLLLLDKSMLADN